MKKIQDFNPFIIPLIVLLFFTGCDIKGNETSPYEQLGQKLVDTIGSKHVNAQLGTTYYIDPTGSNTNNGSIGSPWLTLANACSRVKTSGDIIHVNVGTYIENTTCNLAIGISIVGEGATSVITSTNNTAGWTLMKLESAEGTNGNQSISKVKFDGNAETCAQAISIEGRSNVSIHDCVFVDFKESGVYWAGRNDWTQAPPTIFATGNSFYNNTTTNCSEWYDFNGAGNWGRGHLMIGGQEGMLIHDNTMTQHTRGLEDRNGFIIRFASEGYNKGLKIYNNTITRDPVASLQEDIAIEIWNTLGGLEIYNNNIRGGNVDLGNNASTPGKATIKGDYAFGAKIYNNTIGPLTYTDGFEEQGVIVEVDAEDVYIYKNHFRNLSSPIIQTVYDNSIRTIQNIFIYQNILEECNCSVSNNIWGIRFGGGSNTTLHNINIYNNVIIANAAKYAAGSVLQGIYIGQGTIDHFYIRNNIIKNFDASIYEDGRNGSTMDYLYIENNILYSNRNSNDPVFSNYPDPNQITPTHYTNQNNLRNNPLFVSTTDFHLQSGSPAKNAGLNVVLTSDYEGNPIVGIPDIGAFEFQ